MTITSRRIALCFFAVLCSLFGTAMPASAAPKNPFAGLRVLTIKTVPPMSGFRLTLDGSQYTTRGDGTVRILLSTSQRRALSANLEAHLQPITDAFTYGFVRAHFHGWYSGGYHFGSGDTSGLTEIASFDVDYLSNFTFTNADGAPVDQHLVRSMELRSSEGATVNVEHAGPVWLRAQRVTSAKNGVTLANVDYRFTSVDVHGVNAVSGRQRRFTPARTHQVNVPLRLYQVAFDTTGLFGEREGSSFDIDMPDGTTQKYAIGRRVTVVRDLPPADYNVQVHVHGIGGAQKVSVSRNQKVSLRVLGILDLAAITAAVLIVLGAVLLLGFRARRRRRKRMAIDIDATPPVEEAPSEKPHAVLAGREHQ